MLAQVRSPPGCPPLVERNRVMAEWSVCCLNRCVLSLLDPSPTSLIRSSNDALDTAYSCHHTAKEMGAETETCQWGGRGSALYGSRREEMKSQSLCGCCCCARGALLRAGASTKDAAQARLGLLQGSGRSHRRCKHHPRTTRPTRHPAMASGLLEGADGLRRGHQHATTSGPLWAGPWPPLHDHGPMSVGGHEPEGSVAGDRQVRRGGVRHASATGTTTYEYG